MTVNYSPSGNPMETPLPLIEDGEVFNFNDYAVLVIEPMIDGIALAQDTLGLSAGSVERIVSVQWNTGETGQWAFAPGTVFGKWIDAATGDRMQGAIDLPHGATVTAISVYIDPIAHASIAGMTKPTFNLIELTASTGATGNVGSGTDPSADGAAYGAYHAVVASPLAVVIDRTTKTYFLGFIGESGANSDVSLALFGHVKITYHY